MSEEATDPMGNESSNRTSSWTTTPSQSEIFSSNSYSTTTSFQSEIFSDYNANSESSNRETSRPSSPESGNLIARTLYSLLPEMATVHWTMQDTIHAVREQQGRAVT